MGILTRLLEHRSVDFPSGWEGWSIGGTAAGPTVTEETALKLSTVFACVRILSDNIASFPLLTYERDGRYKHRAVEHPLYYLLKELPNPEMTSFDLRELMIQHVSLWGNAYIEIEWSKGGYPMGMWPLRPDKMTVARVGRELVYTYRLPNGEKKILAGHLVHHLRGLGNGIVGYSVIRDKMKESIGLGLATEEYGARFFGNGARPSFMLKHPGRLGDIAYDRLRDSWNDRHQGLSNAHRIAILEEGMDVEKVGIPPEEAQFLQTRKFQVTEIARWFRIPPHMVADLDRATFTNIEQQSIDFLTHTLRPWLVRSEQALARDLLTEDERRKYFIEYLVDGLLRGDTESRYAAYATGRQQGWLSVNEIRAFENMNPIDGGDEYLTPLNMAPVGEAVLDAEETAEGRQVLKLEDRQERRADVDEVRRARQKLARSYVPLFTDVAGRVVRREVNDLRRAVDKHLRRRSVDSFNAWLNEFYAEWPDVLRENFLPLLLTYAEQVAGVTADELNIDDPGLTDALRQFIDEYLTTFADRQVASSRNQIALLLDTALENGEDPADLIEERANGWEETQPGKLGLGQAFEALNAFVVTTYSGTGVRRLVWAASGDSCPFCRSLDGKTVEINGYFVDAGTEIDGGDDGPLLVRHNKRHGPLHAGCDCVVVAG